jgi:hypothetical protein
MAPTCYTTAMPETPERFHLRADAMAAVEKRLRRRFAVTAALAFALLVVVGLTTLRDPDGSSRSLVFGLLLLFALVVASFVRRHGRFRRRWASFEIALERDAIARTVDGYRPERIARAELTAFEERPAGLVVRGPGGRAVVIPRELDGYERVRAAVLGWRASASSPGPA